MSRSEDEEMKRNGSAGSAHATNNKMQHSGQVRRAIDPEAPQRNAAAIRHKKLHREDDLVTLHDPTLYSLIGAMVSRACASSFSFA